MIIKTAHIVVAAGLLISSCGTQKRILSTSEKSKKAKEAISADSTFLSTLQTATKKKLGEQRVDSTLNVEIDKVITTLQGDLDQIQQTVKAVDFFLESKKNFRPNRFDEDVKEYVTVLDSFQIKKETRDKIYQLLDEAVKADAFKKYGMGAFFKPGVYRIAPKDYNSINQSFQPAIDSMAALSNRYSGIKRTAHVVVVGYADASSFTPDSPLHNELKSYSGQSSPSSTQLNLVLSDLRARELLRNLKSVIRGSANQFSNYNSLKIGYLSYGRGEALPFSNITDYTENDERRRVVVFYWAILPDM